MKYHLWTIGCQMNEADSQRVGSELEKLGYRYTPSWKEADVIVINTCVVRQSAEDKATGFVSSLKPLKRNGRNPVIALMGCLVGVRGNHRLKKVFPHVDVFMPPSEPGPLINFLLGRDHRPAEAEALRQRHALQDGDLLLPRHQQHNLVSAHVPVVYGCNHVCTFCIIPARRGAERSRPVGAIAREVRSLVAQGVKEVTLLGQIVDRYGFDIPDGPRLADLLRTLHDIDGLHRIRFLTSHPNYMDDHLLQTVAELPKVCEHIEVPIQAGHDEVLARMKRGYTVDDYRRLIDRIRHYLPQASIATDVIVGFPGETAAHFQATLDVLAELKMDVCHVAMYSPRPGTVSAKLMPDDVPPEEKKRRLHAVNELQEEIVTEINRRYEGETVEVLVEEKHRGKWKGRTRTNKLVFFEDEADRKGQRVPVKIEWAGPWSMRGEVADAVEPSLPVLSLTPA
ncbi:MAG: tRNA (N6-isopentenyl adenosine(37)-C2)-methylthiotransferase MiaB [Caldilineae bacterium]|nr:MAG: tRNA (N6-isopentenyl adenosine(37)-C2)-methylthiotransferase MiaB [Caldilineae bacterium]